MFKNFMTVLPTEDLDKLGVLANFVLPSIFQHIEEWMDYPGAIETLQCLFVKQEMRFSHVIF